MTRSEKILGGGIILTFTLLCTANVLLLPPYEGFDETAHYSYISILADRQVLPDFRHTPMDATVGNDLLGLPLPYSGANGGITYSKFFNTGFPLEREKAVRRLWQDPQGVASYVPGQGANWEGQHPPLYYLVMIVPYRLSRTWPPGMRLLFLRLFSVALACGSLVFWFKSIKLFRSSSSRRFLLLAGLVITFFPSLWYDLARLGNDSLAALLFAGSFYFLLSTYINGGVVARIQGQTSNKQIVVIAMFFLVPLLLGFVYHMYLRVKFTGVGMGTGGYYLFFAWPIIGLWFVFSFEAKQTIPQKIALLSAFALVSFFDVAGWWRSALVYSGLVEVEKAGLSLTSRGFVSPTMGNIALVLDRLRTLAFPHGAMLLYVMALLVRSALAVRTIFFLSSPISDAQP